MKEKLQIFLLKALAALGLALVVAPIALLLGRYFLPQEPEKWYVLWLFPCVWGCASYLFSGRKRVAMGLLGLIPLGLLGAAWLWPVGATALTLLLPGVFLLLMLPSAYPRMTWEEWPTMLWLGGIVVHLIGQGLATRPELSGLGGVLVACFVAYMLLFLITHNRQSLRIGMHGGQKAPPVIARRNRMLVLGMFLVALLVSCWGPIGEALNAAWAFVKHALGQAVLWFFQLFAQQEKSSAGSSGGDGSMSLMEAFGEAESSDFAKLMEQIFMVVAYVLLAVALCFACWVLFKKLRQLLRYLRGRLRQYADASAADYVDEQESTLNLDEKTRALREKLQKALTRPPRKTPWNALDGRARVRRLYQDYIKKRNPASAMTAQEALARETNVQKAAACAFADLYDQARYSDHPVTTEQADALRERLAK